MIFVNLNEGKNQVKVQLIDKVEMGYNMLYNNELCNEIIYEGGFECNVD